MRGDWDAYEKAKEKLTKAGYIDGNVKKAIHSEYNKLKTGEEEEKKSFKTIVNDYWESSAEPEEADYELMFNAFMNGNKSDYNRMWEMLEEAGKKDSSIKSSMKDRLKSAYWAAYDKKDYAKAQKAKTEFLRLGGKLSTLQKRPKS